MSSTDEQTHFGIGAVSDDELPRGTMLAGGRFTIQALRGAGGMAMLYLARDRDRAADVAFKLIGAKYAGKPAAELRLRNEGAFAERIGPHPNIARPLETGRLEDGRVYLVTEFVRGPSLADLLAMERRLSTTRACRLARDVAAALDAIHGHGFVHRDVKPDNILVSTDGDHEVAKLVDFGLAGEIEPVGERLTAVHERPGTRLYMAPEQLVGARNAPGFDIYALGVSLYEMLCGFAPHESRGVAEILERKLEKPESIAEHRPDLPPELVALVDGCMHPDPSRRIGSAKLVCERLDEALEGLGYASDPSSLPRPASRISEPTTTRRPAIEDGPRTSSRAWVWAAIGVVAIGVGVLGRAQGWWLRTEVPQSMTAELGPLLDTSARSAALTEAPMVAAPAPTEVVPTKPDPVIDPVPAPAPVVVDPPVSDPPASDPPRPKIKPVPVPVAEVPKHETADCQATRERADKAAKTRDWRGVLAQTHSAECWKDRTERLRLVVRSRSGLGEYAACVKQGGASTDTIVAQVVQYCRDQVTSP